MRETKNTFFPNDLDNLKCRAEQGDIPACAKLGSMYAAGLRVKEDESQALNYLEKAAAGGYAASCLYLARHWQNKGKIEKAYAYISLALAHQEDTTYNTEHYNQQNSIILIKGLKNELDRLPKNDQYQAFSRF